MKIYIFYIMIIFTMTNLYAQCDFVKEESDRCKEVKALYNLFCSPEESNSERCVRFQDFVESICNESDD